MSREGQRGRKLKKFPSLSLFRCALDPPDDFDANRQHQTRAGREYVIKTTALFPLHNVPSNLPNSGRLCGVPCVLNERERERGFKTSECLNASGKRRFLSSCCSKTRKTKRLLESDALLLFNTKRVVVVVVFFVRERERETTTQRNRTFRPRSRAEPMTTSSLSLKETNKVLFLCGSAPLF